MFLMLNLIGIEDLWPLKHIKAVKSRGGKGQALHSPIGEMCLICAVLILRLCGSQLQLRLPSLLPLAGPSGNLQSIMVQFGVFKGWGVALLGLVVTCVTCPRVFEDVLSGFVPCPIIWCFQIQVKKVVVVLISVNSLSSLSYCYLMFSRF